LNEYRKRLSQPSGSNARKTPAKSEVKDTVQLSEAGQRKSIMDQVSADIIQRISQTGPKNGHMADDLTPEGNDNPEKKGPQEMDFVYTTIDENNQKSTQIIPITHLKPSMASLATGGETRMAQGGSTSDS
jgi:hypothetical protein